MPTLQDLWPWKKGCSFSMQSTTMAFKSFAVNFLIRILCEASKYNGFVLGWSAFTNSIASKFGCTRYYAKFSKTPTSLLLWRDTFDYNAHFCTQSVTVTFSEISNERAASFTSSICFLFKLQRHTVSHTGQWAHGDCLTPCSSSYNLLR